MLSGLLVRWPSARLPESSSCSLPSAPELLLAEPTAAPLSSPQRTVRAQVGGICLGEFYRKSSHQVIRLEEEEGGQVPILPCPGYCSWTSLVFADMLQAKVK